MSRNLGETALRKAKRPTNAMRAYDSLPPPLRHWLSEAALPWSVKSARKIWKQAKAKGLSTEQALERLAHAEGKTLAKERALRARY